MWARYPQGFEKPGHCLRILRHLYGSHDAPKGWFDLVKQHLTGPEQQLIQSANDECHFYSKNRDLHVVVHVDDFASTGTDDAVSKFRTLLHKRFKMTGGKIRTYYGLDISVSDGYAAISCRGYIERTMAKLNLPARSYQTPMDPAVQLPKLQECNDADLHKRYRTLVGCAQHASTTCRPDVAATVRELASHLQAPAQAHVTAAERALQYLHHTRHLKLEYRGHKQPNRTDFYGTCDASHNATWDSKGITGWAYHLNGGAVSWHSKAQEIEALSSTEAELIACDSATRELRYLHKMMADFGQQVSMPTVLGQDNKSTLTLYQSTHFNSRTRHISLRYHHCGTQQRRGVVRFRYLPTTDMVSDVLSKPLYLKGHQKHTAVLLGHKQLQWPAASDETAHRATEVLVGSMDNI